jgi:hypothetical protein
VAAPRDGTSGREVYAPAEMEALSVAMRAGSNRALHGNQV